MDNVEGVGCIHNGGGSGGYCHCNISRHHRLSYAVGRGWWQIQYPSIFRERVSVVSDRKWYVIHTQSGLENKVKDNLEHRIDALGMKDHVPRVFVPTEEIAEIRGGRKKVTTRTSFPGYVLVEMELNEEIQNLVRTTPGVTGFVGSRQRPVPLGEGEVEAILKSAEERKAKLKPKVDFVKGEEIRIAEGPFANFNGIVDEVYPDKGKLRAMISIFGRSTPVELEYWQVERD